MFDLTTLYFKHFDFNMMRYMLYFFAKRKTKNKLNVPVPNVLLYIRLTPLLTPLMTISNKETLLQRQSIFQTDTSAKKNR